MLEGSGRVAVVSGSFDPVTLGHMDILERGLAIFDHMIVAVLDNPRKTPLFTVAERIALLQAQTANINVTVESFSGLLAEFAKLKGANYILRGVRTETDCGYEISMAQINKMLNIDLETVILVAKPQYALVSSSIIREIVQYAGENFDDTVLDKMVHPTVKKMLIDKILKKGLEDSRT